jgi:pimeloyl-ACP methyl ester carboxylesterase
MAALQKIAWNTATLFVKCGSIGACQGASPRAATSDRRTPCMSEHADPAAAVEAIARTAREVRTPCGEGQMVWRVWGKGEPLVLFHGGSGSWTHWIRNVGELSRHYEVWAADIPGLGDSAMPPQPWVPQSIADVVVAGLGELFAATQRLRLVGFSFGGQIAGLTAARMGQRVRSLTLVGVAALGLRADPREPFAKVRTGMGPAEIAAVYHQNLRVLMFADPANIDALAIHLQAENIRRARFRSRPFAATDNLARALADVTAPVSTIWGTRDIIARPSLEARLDILRRHHPELDVRLIEGAGHWVAYEAADRFNAALLEVLASARGKPA